jgi:uncharacterized repeat protein (TIGR01451 family)
MPSMKTRNRCLPSLVLLGLLWLGPLCRAEEHRATHLGDPAHRFADPVVSEKDMRWRFRDPALRKDMVTVLGKWGWEGVPDDLFNAALTAEVSAVSIPVGAVMPFMSSRVNGRPICLRNVTWAGSEPISAYAFEFDSKGRHYRCVVPKPCSNFYLENLGDAPKPALALSCTANDEVPLARNGKVCLTLLNTGNAAESNLSLTLPLTAVVTPVSATDGGVITADGVRWTIDSLAPGASRQVCLTFTGAQLGQLPLESTATGAVSAAVRSSCSTRIYGIPGLLLEKADDPDPVAVGDTTTYTVKVTNQGTTDVANVQVTVIVAPQLVPLNSSEGTLDGQTVTLPLIPHLGPKESHAYTVVAKGVKAGDGHTLFRLASDALKSPISAEESTNVY